MSNLTKTAADGSTKSIVIPHGLAGITSQSVRIVTANNTNAMGLFSVGIDATNLTILYDTKFPTGDLSYSVYIKP